MLELLEKIETNMVIVGVFGCEARDLPRLPGHLGRVSLLCHSWPREGLSQTCEEPLIATLVDAFGYRFLIRTLELSDQVFEEVYGERISSQERRAAIDAIQSHWDSCPHCQHLDAEHNKEDELIELCLRDGDAETLLLNQWGELKRGMSSPLSH
jgi:hypothetical protein